MRRCLSIFMLISFCLVGCSTAGASGDLSTSEIQKVSMIPTQTENNLSEFTKEFPNANSDVYIKQINSFRETVYRWVNFNSYSDDEFYFPNSTISYDVYYVGTYVENSSDRYILVKLNLEDGVYPEKDYSIDNVYQTYKLNPGGGSISDFMQDGQIEDLAKDTSLEKIAEGEFTIGDPYDPVYKDFDKKDDALAEIKEVVRQRYFTDNIKDPPSQPIFYDETKATEVYVRDFDEQCIKYDEFRMLVYTEDGRVYQATLWYSEGDQKYMCQENTSGNIICYKVSDLDKAKDGELKNIADYYERIKKHSILKITE